jgi:hypothetical protein
VRRARELAVTWLRWLRKGPRAVLLAIGAAFGPPKPPDPPPPVAAQVEEDAER